MTLPLGLEGNQMQTRWKSEIDPLLTNPLNNISILENISLNQGNNVLNHGLGRIQQGWFLVDIQGVASIYRPQTAPFNNLTLTLNASVPVTVSIGVF